MNAILLRSALLTADVETSFERARQTEVSALVPARAKHFELLMGQDQPAAAKLPLLQWDQLVRAWMKLDAPFMFYVFARLKVPLPQAADSPKPRGAPCFS